MTTTQWKPMLTLPISAQRDHIQGSIDAPVTLLEYGDYQCPFCGAAHPVVKAVQARMGDRLLFAFRHFPLTTIHDHAESAAEAAEAAGAQGQFWPMHDTLFLNQNRLREPELIQYAGALGLDVDRFSNDVLGHAHHDRIQEDFMAGVRSGVNGTPTFYINGVRHDGPNDFETLINALERSLVFR